MEILQPIMLPFGKAMEDNFILAHDNAKPYYHADVLRCLQQNKIFRMDCAAQSPDIYPIEYL